MQATHQPAVPSGTLVRRRLVEMLRRGTARPLTLVSAPAGYGKTVLVSSWAERVEGTCSVVLTPMEEDDLSPDGLWTSLLGVLRRGGVNVSGLRMECPDDGVPSALPKLAQRIAAHRSPVVWVLDCGEWQLSAQLGAGISRLLEACGGRLRLVLVTRADPPLPLHRYRLDGSISEIRAEDLVLTASEVSALMRASGIDLAPAEVSALLVRTGGWPTGLRFAAISLAGRADTERAIREFRGDTGNVAAYLMSEVLAKQTPELRDFLLRTCVLDELDPPLVAALTGRYCDDRVLQFVARGNAFIEPVPGQQGRYRFQALFREFLRSQLSFETPTLPPLLHRAAARWYAQSGQPSAAVHHAIAARAWSSAARYFVEGLCVGNLLVGGQATPLRRWLAHLPEETEGVTASVTRAALALTKLDAGRCTAELRAARAQLDRDEAGRTPACMLAIAVLDAVVTSLGPDLDAGLEAALMAQSALRTVPAEALATRPELRVVVAGAKARVLLERGDFAVTSTALDEGIEAAESLPQPGALADLHGLAALVEAMTGNLNRAAEMAAPWEVEPDDHGAAPPGQAGTLALAWVRMDRYDLDEVECLLDAAERARAGYDATVLGPVLALLRARLWRARGDFALARAGLRAARPSPTEGRATGWLARSLIAEEGAALLAEGRAEDVIEMIRGTAGCDHVECELVLHQALVSCDREAASLSPMSRAAAETAPLDFRVEHWLVRAAESIHREDVAEGRARLEQALKLAAPQRLRRPFYEAPGAVRDLLEASGLGERTPWLQPRRSASGERAEGPRTGDRGWTVRVAGGQAPVVNPLTAKEKEVLGHLAELLTTDEIADAMFVSVNTVRSHVRSILRKLGVTRRNEAVRRAWELRLLPPPTAA